MVSTSNGLPDGAVRRALCSTAAAGVSANRASKLQVYRTFDSLVYTRLVSSHLQSRTAAADDN